MGWATVRARLLGLLEIALLSPSLSSSLLMTGVGVCDLRLTSLLTRSFASELRGCGGGGLLWTADEGLDRGVAGFDGVLTGILTMTFLMVG